MVIIVEGVDKSGKSTLSEALSKAIPGIVIKITDRPKDSSLGERNKIKEHYWRIVKFIRENPDTTIILDRFFPSEICYSTKRGYDASKDPQLKDLENWFVEKKFLFVFCNPGRYTIAERINRTPDEHVTQIENLEILSRYEDFFGNTKLRVLELDTKKTVEQLIEEIKNNL